MIVSRDITIVQVLEGMSEITTQLPILRTVSVRILSSIRLADCQCYSVKSYQEEIKISNRSLKNELHIRAHKASLLYKEYSIQINNR